MLTKLEIESKLKAIKPLLTDKFHVSSIGYFGSYSTGQQNEKSDLDLLVEFSEPVGWEFFYIRAFFRTEYVNSCSPSYPKFIEGTNQRINP